MNELNNEPILSPDKDARIGRTRPQKYVDMLAASLDVIKKRGQPVDSEVPIKLLIATPFYDMKGWSPYIRSLIHSYATLLIAMKMDVSFVSIDNDSFIDRARNRIANNFMNSDFTDLLFIDSDEEWEPEGLARIVMAKGDVVAAGYPVKNKWNWYAITPKPGPGDKFIQNETGQFEAIGAPGGFMKIKRTVFEQIALAYPDQAYIDKDEKEEEVIRFDFYGTIQDYDNFRVFRDDIAFIQRWLSIGGKLWVEPNVTITHYGFEGHKGNYLESLKQAKKDSNEKNNVEYITICHTSCTPKTEEIIQKYPDTTFARRHPIWTRFKNILGLRT